MINWEFDELVVADCDRCGGETIWINTSNQQTAISIKNVKIIERINWWPCEVHGCSMCIPNAVAVVKTTVTIV